MELNLSDLTALLFVLVILWLVLEIDGGFGGGHRARVPVPF